MVISGLRSTASVSRALKELQALGAIGCVPWRGDRGKMRGLELTFKGMPTATSVQARDLYRTAVVRQKDRLEHLLKELAGGDEGVRPIPPGGEKG